MKKFKHSSNNNSKDNSSSDAQDIRTNKIPIFAVGRVKFNKNNDYDKYYKNFVKSEFDTEGEIMPPRYFWKESGNTICAMEAIKSRIKLLEYRLNRQTLEEDETYPQKGILKIKIKFITSKLIKFLK